MQRKEPAATFDWTWTLNLTFLRLIWVSNRAKNQKNRKKNQFFFSIFRNFPWWGIVVFFKNSSFVMHPAMVKYSGDCAWHHFLGPTISGLRVLSSDFLCRFRLIWNCWAVGPGCRFRFFWGSKDQIHEGPSSQKIGGPKPQIRPLPGNIGKNQFPAGPLKTLIIITIIFTDDSNCMVMSAPESAKIYTKNQNWS